MEEFAALAARLGAGIGELRGCLILSRDGLELGAYPPGEDHLVKPAWIRFAQLGDPEKGFVEFADELWVYVRRGPYAIFAVSGASVRPGLLMDQVEQMLHAAEEARQRREALKIPEVPDAPKSRPRTSLHKDVRAAPPLPTAVRPEPEAVAGIGAGGGPGAAAGPASPAAPAPPATLGGSASPPAAAAAPAVSPSSPRTDPPAPSGGKPPSLPLRDPTPRATRSTVGPSAPAPRPRRRATADDGLLEKMAAAAAAAAAAGEDLDPELDPDLEVDRVLLAQEFSRLLQEAQESDEAGGDAPQRRGESW